MEAIFFVKVYQDGDTKTLAGDDMADRAERIVTWCKERDIIKNTSFRWVRVSPNCSFEALGMQFADKADAALFRMFFEEDIERIVK